MTTNRTLVCESCGRSTDVSPRIVVTECPECGAVVGASKHVLRDRLEFIYARIGEYTGAIMLLREEERLVKLAMLPFLPKREVVWQSSDVDLHCHNCGAVTRWIYREKVAACQDNKCMAQQAAVKKPRASSNKMSPEEMTNLLAQMGIITDDTDDTEYIKKGR